MEQALTSKVEEKKEDIELLKEELNDSLIEKVDNQKIEVEHLKAQLEILNPKNVLSRGYSISVDESGKSITSVKSVKKESTIRTILKDGEVISRVTEVKE